MKTTRILRLPILAACLALAAGEASAGPVREWNWRMPGEVYRELEFSDRAQVDRAAKFFQQAVDAENGGRCKVTDLVPRYRNAAGEWRKLQVQGETGEGNEALLAYAVFMQGYARQLAHDRNEAIKLYNEVLDIYPEQRFIAIPARYMLSLVHREMGDVRQADALLDEIADDREADGNAICVSVLRSLGDVRWRQGRIDEAAECWSKIVHSKRQTDWSVWTAARDKLALALVAGGNFAELEAALCAGAGEDRRKRVEAVAANAKWISEADRRDYHTLTRYLNDRYGKQPSVRRAEYEKIRRGYAAWLQGEAGLFAGYDDGWAFAVAQLRAQLGFAKTDAVLKRIKALEPMVKNAKPDLVNGRARTLAMELAAIGQHDAARAAALLAKDNLYRLRLQYEIENEVGAWKAAIQYLSEYTQTQPPPPAAELRQAKYDLAWMYRQRVREPEKAAKVYQELDDPPRSLWGLAESLRDCGKRDRAYTTLVEIASVFPNEAPEAVLRQAQWRESDGDRVQAVALYRRLLSHPKWKESRASSAAHQALERLGVLTGGAMTNEVR